MRYNEVTPYSNMQDFLDRPVDRYYVSIAIGLYYTGARIGELIKLKQRDVELSKDDDSFLEVRIQTEKNKHSPYRFVPINYCEEPFARDVFLKGLEPEELLFPKYNPVIKDSSFMRVIRRKFNFFWSVAPHYFRHCRLTHCITEFDFNDQELVKYAGWSDSKPAKWYVSLKTTDLQKKMKGRF